MTEQRFQEHYQSDASAFLVIPKKGAPYRADGKPLSVKDRELLRGRDSLAQTTPADPQGKAKR